MNEGNIVCGSGLFIRRVDLLKSEEKKVCKINSRKREKVKTKLYEKQKGLCLLCGEHIDASLPEKSKRSMTIDHIHPKSLGGRNNIKNLQLAHKKCNMRKASDITTYWPDWFGVDISNEIL